jgi:hypothetical protein
MPQALSGLTEVQVLWEVPFAQDDEDSSLAITSVHGSRKGAKLLEQQSGWPELGGSLSRVVTDSQRWAETVVCLMAHLHHFCLAHSLAAVKLKERHLQFSAFEDTV